MTRIFIAAAVAAGLGLPAVALGQRPAPEPDARPAPQAPAPFARAAPGTWVPFAQQEYDAWTRFAPPAERWTWPGPESREWFRVEHFDGLRWRDRAGIPRLQDPADSLYILGRAALGRQDFRAAVDLLRQVYTRFPRSAAAPDALYWAAFAAYRIGDEESLRLALNNLEAMRYRYTVQWERGDAPALQIQVLGALARLGDTDAAERLAIAAGAASPDASPAESRAALETALAAAQERLRSEQAAARAEYERLRARELADQAAVAPAGARAVTGAVAPGAVAPPGARAVTGPGVVVIGARASGDPPCDRDDQDVRLAALNALRQTQPDQAAPILRRVLALRDDCSVPLRRRAVMILGQRPGPENEAILLETLRTDPNVAVRQQAVIHLGNVNSEAAVAALSEIALGTGDEALRTRAITALARNPDARSEAVLRQIVRRPDVQDDVKRSIIGSLRLSPRPDETAEFLRELYAQLPDEDLKEQVLIALSRTPTSQPQWPWLLRVARDEREAPRLRQRATFWAARNSDAPSAELARLYDDIANPDMRQQVVAVLGQRSDDDALTKLIDIARTAGDADVRGRAIFWLGRSNDPRAIAALAELIDA